MIATISNSVIQRMLQIKLLRPLISVVRLNKVMASYQEQLQVFLRLGVILSMQPQVSDHWP